MGHSFCRMLGYQPNGVESTGSSPGDPHLDSVTESWIHSEIWSQGLWHLRPLWRPSHSGQAGRSCSLLLCRALTFSSRLVLLCLLGGFSLLASTLRNPFCLSQPAQSHLLHSLLWSSAAGACCCPVWTPRALFFLSSWPLPLSAHSLVLWVLRIITTTFSHFSWCGLPVYQLILAPTSFAQHLFSDSNAK